MAKMIVATASLAGCVTGPIGGERLDERTEQVPFQGYATVPGQRVVVRMRAMDGALHTFATAYSSTSPVIDRDGDKWYAWEVETALPQAPTYWAWAGSTAAAGELRVELGGEGGTPAYVFSDVDQQLCVVQKIQTMGYRRAATACGLSGHELWLFAPCGVVGRGANCYTVPTSSELEDHPFDFEYDDRLGNAVQGMTHDSANWYFTRSGAPMWGGPKESNLWKHPVGTNLTVQPTMVVGNPWYGTWNHFGDPAYYGGRVYVPLEPDYGGSATINAVGVFYSSTLGVANRYDMPVGSPQRTGGNFPWIARNPVNGHFYSSKFEATHIYEYAISASAITYLRSYPIVDNSGNPMTIGQAQGGDFSASGRLYVTSNGATKGVKVIDLSIDGEAAMLRTLHVTVEPGESEELEGMTIWDLDDGRAPGVRGQIHTLVIDEDWPDANDLYFKHLRVSNPGDL